MVAFEVRVNCELICVAGAEDLGVLSTNITAVGTLGKRSKGMGGVDLRYHVGGLTARRDPARDVHPRWKSSSLRTGDVLEVRVVEVTQADKPKSRTPAYRPEP